MRHGPVAESRPLPSSAIVNIAVRHLVIRCASAGSTSIHFCGQLPRMTTVTECDKGPRPNIKLWRLLIVLKPRASLYSPSISGTHACAVRGDAPGSLRSTPAQSGIVLQDLQNPRLRSPGWCSGISGTHACAVRDDAPGSPEPTPACAVRDAAPGSPGLRSPGWCSGMSGGLWGPCLRSPGWCSGISGTHACAVRDGAPGSPRDPLLRSPGCMYLGVSCKATNRRQAFPSQ